MQGIAYFTGHCSSQNVKKFDAGRADVSTIRNGVGDFSLIQNNVKSWRDKIGMIG